ncbi:four helix bundle protein [Hymenobacter psychrotolerans]|uniref:Four helix bundle protein n=1 Tax=Hymenobacter psychrotolerans DSM 18569 TaxID=1121959 RepID=A0A1M6ST88_9BACT|nr:four helix bundle protein [Hymenobacter psychrotolerans]SHK47866.1 four helix bundle protein [Hymenobacter psychrotolerans DSM 18569]
MMDIDDKAARNEAFRNRTKVAALRIIQVVEQLPRTPAADVLGKQILRSATSVAANYRAACRGRSAAEFFAKLSICVEEADETQLWLELLGDANLVPKARLSALELEYAQITAILTKARKTASGE